MGRQERVSAKPAPGRASSVTAGVAGKGQGYGGQGSGARNHNRAAGVSIMRIRLRGAKDIAVELADCSECPICTSHTGQYGVGKSQWRYCSEHKLKWLFGWLPESAEADEEEQRRVYDDLGVGKFEHVYKDELEEALLPEQAVSA
jgi:hypothetical protein